MDFEFRELSDDELTRELGEVNQHVKQRVNRKFIETWRVFQEHFPNRGLATPRIEYDLRGHTAGYAIGGHTIRLNADTLNDPRYVDDMILNTLPHEVAHIVVHQLFPGAKGHGVEWRRMMHLLGIPATRCHQYETKAARTRSKPYTYYCGCDTPHQISKTLHNRMLQGRTYRCRRCGYNLHEGRDRRRYDD